MERCLGVYVFLLSIARTYISDLWNSKWQSDTMSNVRERTGAADITLEMNR